MANWPTLSGKRRNLVCHRNFGPIPEPSKIVGGDQPQVIRTMDCIGAACSLFIHATDGEGKPIGAGMCGDAVQAIALSRIATLMELDFESEHEVEAGADEPATEPTKEN